MNREELIELVEKIINPVGKTEEELSRLMSILEENVPHPEPGDLIYWNDKQLTPDDIVDQALSYKPIQI